MPARLDKVQVQAGARFVVISWSDREQLLARLLTLDPVPRGRKPVVSESRREIVNAFTAVGASRPASLTAGQREELFAVLDVWDGDLSEGLRELHVAALRRLGAFAGRRVLEMGCGDGRLTLGIARDATHVLRLRPRRRRHRSRKALTA